MEGFPTRVFVASLADVFERHLVPEVGAQLDTWRERLWDLIEQTPNLDWLLLTKRPENVLEMVPWQWLRATPDEPMSVMYWPGNVWIGTTIESPKVFDRLDHLRAIPARVRFVSAEPLLADISDIDLTGISWVICGGESGPGARPMHPEWARRLRDRVLGMEGYCDDGLGDECCDTTPHERPAFMFKQWGEWLPEDHMPDNETAATRVLSLSEHHGSWFAKIGKGAASRRLDGRTWDEVPRP